MVLLFLVNDGVDVEDDCIATLYCSGIGTEMDSPLSFTVQIFTTESLNDGCVGFEDASTIPVAHNIVRCIHSNPTW